MDKSCLDAYVMYTLKVRRRQFIWQPVHRLDPEAGSSGDQFGLRAARPRR